MRYDPALAPDPEEWLALDEQERVLLVRQHHKRARERSGSPQLHAIVHATVETQLADAHPDVTAAFERLSQAGLDRHSVIHAIGSVLAGDIYGIMKSRRSHDPQEYARKLKELTAESWLRSGEE